SSVTMIRSMRQVTKRFTGWSEILRTLLTAAICLAPAAALAQTGENVLVVVNDAVPDSARVGEAYAAARGVPDSHIVHLRTAVEESVSRQVYVETIENPIRAWIARYRLHDQILYIVLTKGVPIR